MSIDASRAVWKHSKAKGSKKLVMLCIADHLNSDGLAWPSIARIAEETGVSERQVTRAVTWLVEKKELAIDEKGNGRGYKTTYRILLPLTTGNPDKMSSFPVGKKDDISSIKGDILSEKDDILSPPSITIIEPPEEPSLPPTPEEPEPDLVGHWAITDATIKAFEGMTKVKRPYIRSEKAKARFSEEWVDPVHQMKALANGHTEEIMQAAYQELRAKRFTVSSPMSLYPTFCRIYQERNGAQGNGRSWQDVMDFVANGRPFADLPPEAQNFIRANGGDGIRSASQFDLNKLEKQYVHAN